MASTSRSPPRERGGNRCPVSDKASDKRVAPLVGDGMVSRRIVVEGLEFYEADIGMIDNVR